MYRYFLEISYDGTDYHGWQIQPNATSVQETLQKALSILLRIPIEIIGAGRTDTGVHASRMVAHFEVDQLLDSLQFVFKLNRLLPRDIAANGLRRVTPEAHARFSATSRTYKYYLTQRRSPFHRHYTYPYLGTSLDFEKMNEAAQLLFNYTDFTSFSKLHTDAKTNNCCITQAQWHEEADQVWVFTIQADRFLRNMVRAVVGTLLEVGRGRLSLEGFAQIIEKKDRCLAGTSVPGNALFLVDITYPEICFEVE